MLDKLRSRRLQYFAGVVALYLALFAILRAIFYFGFSEVGDTVNTDAATLWKTLFIGVRFDLRLALLVVLPVVPLLLLPRFNLTQSAAARKLAEIWFTLATVVLLVVYIIDFGHYVYLGIRLNHTVARQPRTIQMTG